MDAEARQIAVEDLEHHVFLSAGAGAGKTRVLVERYLNVLRQQRAEVSEIVAVTFTEKAANEMKERLRQVIAPLCHSERSEESQCGEILPLHFVQGQNDSPSLSDWQRHLRALENAPISTIHSFCARLLREQAMAAGVDPLFAVLDETDAALLLDETLEDFVRLRLSSEFGVRSSEYSIPHSALRTPHLALARAWGVPRVRSLLRDMINDRERVLRCLDVMPSDTKQLLNLWRTAVEEHQAKALQVLLNDAARSDALNVLRQNEPRNSEDIAAQRRAKILGCAARAVDESLSVSERIQAVCEMDTHINLQGGAQKNWESKEALAAVKEAFRQLRALCKPFVAQTDSLRYSDADDRAAEIAVAFAHELRLALAAYDRAKQGRSALDFDDLQLRVRDLLRNHPDVRAEYQRRFKFVMVDEFQDTNALQKEILWVVAGKGMRDEGLGMRDDTAHPSSLIAHPSSRLFIVGDAKQGIYRFRGADVSVFNATAEEFKRDPACRTLELSANFRTQHPLVEFFNDVFSHPAVMGGSEGKALYEAAYAPMTAHRTDESAGPHVEFLLAKPPEQESIGQLVNESMKDMASLREVEAHAIAQRIKALVNDGARYGDVALLFAAMTDAAIYENALRVHDIPYYIVAGSGLYRRQEVKDLLNFLKVLENVHDDIALVGLLRSPFFAVSDETLYWLCQPRSRSSLYDKILRCAQNDKSAHCHSERSEESCLDRIALEELARLQRAAQLIAALREVKNRLRLSQLMNLILERTGFTAVLLAQFMGEQMVSNVRKVIDIARAFERKGNFTLQDFIAHIGTFVDAAQRESEAATEEEESNIVKLLTVHRAKGLEWSVVFVPDLARSRRPRSDMLLAHPRYGFAAKVEDDEGKLTDSAIAALIREEESRMETAEHRRLLYVAATRARDRLILSSPFKLQKDTWLQWLNDALGRFEEIGKAAGESRSYQAVVRWFDEKIEQGAPERVGSHARSGAECGDELVVTRETQWSAVRDGTPLRCVPDYEQVRRQVQPIPMHVAGKRCFTVDELRTHLWCPQKYFLAHVRCLPEAMGQWVNGSMGQWVNEAQVEELVRFVLRKALTPSPSPTLRERDEPPLSRSVGEGLGVRDDVDSLIRTCLRQKALVCDDALVAHLEQSVSRFLQSDLWRRLSGMNLQSSVHLQWKCGDAQIEGTIDLLGVDETGGVHVAQFHVVSPRHPADETAHRFEVGLLCDAVNVLCNESRERTPCRSSEVKSASLYYLEDGREETFDPSTAEQAQHAAENIIAQIRHAEFERRADAPCSVCGHYRACAQRTV